VAGVASPREADPRFLKRCRGREPKGVSWPPVDVPLVRARRHARRQRWIFGKCPVEARKSPRGAYGGLTKVDTTPCARGKRKHREAAERHAGERETNNALLLSSETLKDGVTSRGPDPHPRG
jgi:hypothetical protein